MKVVIMGCGRVGAALAVDLDREGNDVLVLDIDESALAIGAQILALGAVMLSAPQE